MREEFLREGETGGEVHNRRMRVRLRLRGTGGREGEGVHSLDQTTHEGVVDV